MARLEELDLEMRRAVVDHVARIKHDLGKYVAFQIRWLAEDASDADRRDALAADLLATRRGPEGTVDAPRVWAMARSGLVGQQPLIGERRADISDEPLLAEIDAQMAIIEQVIVALRNDTASTQDITRGTQAAFAVADACRSLQRRVREAQ